MDLPKSIVKEFAKQAVEKKPTVDKPTQLVGTVHVEDGQIFVYLDGSNGNKTPVSETVAYQSGDRVLVSIQNRKATIIGNYTGPSINQALDNVIVEYALSSNSVSFIAWPGEKGEWNTIAPEKEDGSYMWQRTTKISTNPLINPEISLTCIQGSDGENGYTPYIGSNGNWWINGVDTGYSAEGDDGHSPYVDTTTNTWWEWDANIGNYHDTGIVPQGPGVFKSIVFKRFSSQPSPPTGGSYLSPVPSGWSDGIPSGTEQIWISTRVFTSDGESPQTSEWTTPQMASDTPDIDFEYSWIVTNPGNPTDNPDNWSNAATENSIWMAVRKKSIGTWSSWEINKIKGETGADGYSPTVSTGTSSDGSTTLTVTNKDGSTTTTLVDSKARADIDNLEIGGRNYVVKQDSFSLTVNGITFDYDGDVYHVYGTNTKTDTNYFVNTFVDTTNVFEPGAVYTISTTTPLPSGLYLGINTRNSIGTEIVAAWNSYFYGNGSKTSNTFTCTQDTNGELRGFFGVKADCGTVDVTFKIKLEKGNKATDWTPAPEDVDFNIENIEIGGRNLIVESKVSNGWINKNGVLQESIAYRATDYIPVTPGDTIVFQLWTHSNERSWIDDTYFDSDKNYVTGYDGEYLTTNHIIKLYTVPSGASYVRISYAWADGYKAKLEKGNKATDWTPAPEDVDAGIANVQTGVDSLNDSVFGVQTFEYILDGVTIPVHKREDGTYYYILNDEEVTVAESDLVHDADGNLVSYQDGGIYESLDNISENIGAIDTKVNSFDARETAIYNAIQDNSLIARKNARVEGNSLIITNDTATEAIANLLNYLQLNADSIVIYGNGKDIVTIAKTADDSGFMKMNGTSLLQAQESRLSTIRLRSADGTGNLALVAGSDGHVSLKEVLD